MSSRSTGAIVQQWDPVVISRRKPKSADLKDPKVVNNAIRAGAQVETIKKFDAGQNKKKAEPVVSARKLNEQTEPGTLNRVPREVRAKIQKARLAKKMSQAELAKQINERVQVVQEYENGKAVLNQGVLAKMEKVLGVKLRRRCLDQLVVFSGRRKVQFGLQRSEQPLVNVDVATMVAVVMCY